MRTTRSRRVQSARRIRRLGGVGACAALTMGVALVAPGLPAATAATATVAAAGLPAGLPQAGFPRARLPQAGLPQVGLDRLPAGLAVPKPDPAMVADLVAKRLGSRTAGGYIDGAGRPVVTITRAADAATVRSMGAVPKTVARGGAVLTKATDRLRRTAALAGTGWAVDPATAQVVVWADATVSGSRLAGLRKTVNGLGGAVRLERSQGTLSTFIAGGAAIYGGGSRCSLGFNVRSSSGVRYFLTAGHCGDLAAKWTLKNGTVLGARVGSSFPGNDYALFRYINTKVVEPGAVSLYNGTTRDISSAGNPVVGQTVWRSGSTTRLRSGKVTALNATVNYGRGDTVGGLIRTTVCAEPGDSGGPLFSGNRALGLTSGGTGNCKKGGVTYFQPVYEALSKYKVGVY